ncbi:hypothetical protein Dda_8758 [Drechslerella dactyloides]|uniref:Uncharacterized protein n=1 Tax=Drechslerella dactyloides TaxID=74499 RepID=A0AAD6IR61_DREDA|nr:hypothetical protein Dda_8758 [Drechslerella dactyloides]
MITTMGGDWYNPVYIQEDKTSFYSKLRPYKLGTDGSDPTTSNLPEDQLKFSIMSVPQFVKEAMSSEYNITKGYLRNSWLWGMGYVLRERWADPRITALGATFILEVIGNRKTFDIWRQQMLDALEAADKVSDGPTRAVCRRTVLEYVDVRSYRRIIGQGNRPVYHFPGDALRTMSIGGGWSGTISEVCEVTFPGSISKFEPGGMLESFAAFANAMASIPRDQREGTTNNSIISIYSEPGNDLATDLTRICKYIDATEGPELSMLGHLMLTNNNHSRYIMLSVFLSAIQLGNISLANMNFQDIWLANAIKLVDRMAVPTGSLLVSRLNREQRIRNAISRLWEPIKVADEDHTEASVEASQLELNKFLQTECMEICWRRADPTVMWGTCLGYFRTMCDIDGIADLIMQGDTFKHIRVKSDGYEPDWLREIYAWSPKQRQPM